MAERVIIKEVAARDGLQAQPKHLTVEQRMALVAALAETGVPELEIGSFVSPKAVPQMAGTDEIADNLPAVLLLLSCCLTRFCMTSFTIFKSVSLTVFFVNSLNRHVK